jgi:hypothetical protein
MSLNNSRFLNQIKLKAALPTGRFTDQEILDITYDILLTDVQPFLISLRQEYYTKKSTSTIVAGTASYPLNSRALGLSLRELKWTDSSNAIKNLRQLSPEDIEDNTQGTPTGFYFEGVYIVLYPTPNVTGTLTQSFFQRINKPVETSACAIITSIDTVTGIITATPPSTWTTADSFDFISRNNSNDTLAKDLTISAISSTTITFTASDLPSSLAIGDYIALAGETPYIQVPDDAISLVQALTIVDLLESMGDIQAVQLAGAKAEKLKAGLARVMGMRIEGEGIKFRPQI